MSESPTVYELEIKRIEILGYSSGYEFAEGSVVLFAPSHGTFPQIRRNSY